VFEDGQVLNADDRAAGLLLGPAQDLVVAARVPGTLTLVALWALHAFAVYVGQRDRAS
jgi:hypothetical protein